MHACLDAFRSTISDFKIEKGRAFGLPLTDEAVNETLVAPVKVDDKGRVSIPKYLRVALGWKPGDSLQLRISLEKEGTTFSLVKSKRVPRVRREVCERFLELPEGFFHFCFDNNPLTENELERAINENMDMLSILLEDTPDVPIYFRKIFGTRMRVRSMHMHACYVHISRDSIPSRF